MKLDLNNFSNANTNIEILTKDINSKQYVMLDMTAGEIKVCYSDGKVSYIETIEGEAEPEDKEAKVVVELGGLLQKLGICKVKAPMAVDPLQVQITSDDALTLNCQKYINRLVRDADGELVDNGDGEALTEREDTNKISTQLKYQKINDSIKFSMTTKMKYDEIFSGDNWVTCGVSEFKALLNKLSKTDGARDCYISPNKKLGFSVGTAYTAVLPIDFESVPCALSVSAVKKLYNILNKLKVDTINLRVQDSMFLNVVTEDENLGLVFGQNPVVQQQLATLATFESVDYAGQGVIFYKAVLSDMVDGTVAVSGPELDTELNFTVNGDVVTASTVKKGTGNGIDNLSVNACEVIGEIGQFNSFKIELSFNVLKTILSNCDGNYTEFSFATVDDSKYLRISDIAREGNESNILGYYYLCV